MNEVSALPSTSIAINFYFWVHYPAHRTPPNSFQKSPINPHRASELWSSSKGGNFITKTITQTTSDICTTCSWLNPKETLGVAFLSNTHMLGLSSLWIYCNTDPSETLCGSVGKGSWEFVKARGRGEIRASLSFLHSKAALWREETRGRGQARILNRASDKSEFQDIYADMKPPN